MPRKLFEAETRRAPEGIDGIRQLADKCITSLTATAIQFARYSDMHIAVLLSEGDRVCFATMPEPPRQLRGIGDWLTAGDPLPKRTAMAGFNLDPHRVERGESRKEAAGSQLGLAATGTWS